LTLPRLARPGATYLVTRRCWNGSFFLVPRPVVTNAVGYCLAVAANRYGIRLHAFVVMSNHWHAVLTDTETRIDEFLCYVHSLVARVLNLNHGRRDGFWSRRPTSLVCLETADAVMRALVYVHTNPVKAGLTRSGVEWPGLRGLVTHTTGHTGVQERPKRFFRYGGPCPLRSRLRLTMPPQFAHAPEAFRAQLQAAVRQRENQVRSAMKENGKPFMGISAIRRRRWDTRPPKDISKSRVSPTVASRDKDHRIHMLRERAKFLQQYRDAYRAWRGGRDKVEFPPGTLKMRYFPGVTVRKPDA